MSKSRFKTLRHIETVRNYLNLVIRELTLRQEQHDQTKLESPEVEIFEEYTPKFRGVAYGSSDEYRAMMREMKVAIDHHNCHNRHHPEFFTNGIQDMNLIDLIELLCDWKAAGMRHNDGDLFKSIEMNQERFGYSDELKQILIYTAAWINTSNVFHKANES